MANRIHISGGQRHTPQPDPIPPLRFETFTKVIFVIGKISGVVPYDELQQPKQFCKSIFTLIYFWATYIHLVLSIIMQFAYFVESVQKKVPMTYLMVMVTCMGFLLVSIVKMSVYKLNENRLNEILDQLKALYPDQIDSKSAEKCRKRLWFLKLFSVMYFVVVVVFQAILYITSIWKYFSTGYWEKLLPYNLWYWYDWRKPVVFELTFLHQLWGSTTSVTVVVLVDSLYCIIILLISMQFELLGKRLSTNEDNVQEFDKCIEQHLQLIELCNRFERIYSPSLLVTFLGSSAIICFALFVTLIVDDAAESIRFSILLSVYVMNIYLLCYYGSVLMEKSSNIAHQVFNGNWYKMSKKCQKMCLMILIRGQREEKMTALKFQIVSLPCFTRILSTAFSYFTLLKAVHEKF